MRRLLIGFGVALAAGSCAAAQSALPPPANWRASVDVFLQRELLDPERARSRVVREPRYDVFKVGSFPAGWGVCYAVNSPNAYGGMTGEKTFLLVLGQDGVRDVFTTARRADARFVAEECARPADQAVASSSVEPSAVDYPPGVTPR
jgi:hypothetical protein